MVEATERRSRGWWTVVLLVLCAVPHVLRMTGEHSGIWEGMFAGVGHMLSHGYEPYVDVTHVHFLTGETILALAFKVFGVSARVVEVVNFALVMCVALLLRTAGRRTGGGEVAGSVAALFWSWSSLVVHFNLYQRETWAAAGTALAFVAYSREDGPGRLPLVAAGLLVAMSIKLTAGLVAVGFFAHLLLCGKGRSAVVLTLWTSAGLALMTLGYWLVWGWPFLWQVFLFAFFRAESHDFGLALSDWLGWQDPASLVGIAGLLAWGLPNLRKRGGAPVLVVVAYFLYCTTLSPTLWNHNMINFAAPLALLSGGFAADTVRGRRFVRSGLLVAAVFGGMIAAHYQVPGWRWMRYRDPIGVERGRERRWLEEQADFVARNTEPGDVILSTEPWVAIEADRIDFVRYWDLQPVALAIESSLAKVGLAETFARRDEPTLGDRAYDPEIDGRFTDLYKRRIAACAEAYVRPLILDALKKREIALVLLPLPPPYVLHGTDLFEAGYERFTEGNKLAWRRPQPARNRVRPLYQP